jgi:hypothetical protein
VGVNQRARHQAITGIGESAVWYSEPGVYQLDVNPKHTAISVWIYRMQAGASAPADDLSGCKAVAADIVQHM